MIREGVLQNNDRLILTTEWYCTLEVLFKMVPYVKEREGAFLISKAEDPKKSFFNTRYLCIHCVRDFNYLLQQGLHVLDGRWYNLYYSIAKFKDKFPFMQFGSDRKAKIKFWVENKMCPSITKYDFFMDIDCSKEQFEAGKETVRQISDVLNEFNIHYEVRSSGKGFHIICDGEQFNVLDPVFSENYEDERNICNTYHDIANNFKLKISELVDTGMYDLRRVTKIPYSLVQYVDEIRVCIPFIEGEFEAFKYEDGQVQNFIDNLSFSGNWRTLLRERETFIFNKDKVPSIKGFVDKWAN